MQLVALRVKKPDFTRLRAEGPRIDKLLQRASIEVTDLAAGRAQRRIQARMRSVGLGRLDRAVGYTSALKKGQRNNSPLRRPHPYGVIFAKGGDESRAGGALEAYSRGTTIRPQSGSWLAIPTEAAPRLVGVGGRRRRLEPKYWASAGLNQKVGRLIFRQISPRLALLVVRRVSLSPKTGQAKALGKRAPRTRIVPDKDVVVFVLIRETRRAKRFDKDEEIRFEQRRIPFYLAVTIQRYRGTGR